MLEKSLILGEAFKTKERQSLLSTEKEIHMRTSVRKGEHVFSYGIIFHSTMLHSPTGAPRVHSEWNSKILAVQKTLGDQM